MTDAVLVERTLAELLQTQPSVDAMRRMDIRIAQAITARPTVGAARLPRRFGRRRVVLGLLAAAALTMGAGGALGLYDGMGAGMDYGFSIQMARSAAINASAVDDGFRVTIDRAYLDGERLMLAVRVADERKRPEVSDLMAMYSVVTDDTGTWAGAGTATNRPLGQWDAASLQWRLAPGPVANGTHRFHVDIPHIFWRDRSVPVPSGDDPTWNPYHEQPGDWAFDIEVPVDGGATAVHPGTQVDIDGTHFTVEELVIGHSAVRLRMTYDDPGAMWSLGGDVRHGGETYPFVVQNVGEPGIVEIQADGGADDPSGDWTITITAADRQLDGGPERRIDGPWRVDLRVP